MQHPPQEIRDAINSNNIESLQSWLRSDPEPVHKVKQECISLAMPTSSLENIEELLHHGTSLTFDSLWKAIVMEPTIFQ
ncbi:hypothetical protein HRS9139_04586 [Pyrenophora teres f. teres]|nr:hypothetical protein HRS9139_04586 [Pyrenophora teres f. teres]